MNRQIVWALLIIGLGLAGCVAPPAAPSGGAAAPAEPAATTEPAGAAFPVTIEHKFGSTTIAEPPERVMALGYTDQDPILALGVKPIAIRYWFGDTEDQVWPWAEEALGDAEPAIMNMPFGELSFETIAALQPDLIIAISAGITDEEYATLSQIAPTLPQSSAYVDFGVPWQEQTIVIGRALGKEPAARELVAETEALFAQARLEHPEFDGVTAAIAAPAGDGQYFFSGPQHERQRFLTSLGFILPDELAEIAGDAFYGTISGERLDLLDTGILIWTVTTDERAAIEANPVYQSLAVAQEDRHIFLDSLGQNDLIAPALVYGSVLSLPLAFEELVPMLAQRLDAGS